MSFTYVLYKKEGREINKKRKKKLKERDILRRHREQLEERNFALLILSKVSRVLISWDVKYISAGGKKKRSRTEMKEGS